MTSGDHNLQDAELDAFLAGRDELSQQLAALAQPDAPKQVNDAIVASITAQLAQEQAAKAAPAPQLTSVTPRPAANMARWRAPAALAASLVGALLLTLEWQRADDAQQATMSAQQQPVASVQQSAPPQPPSTGAPAPSSAPTASSASAKAAPKDVDPALQPAPQAMPSQQRSASPRARPAAELAGGPAPVQPAPIASPAPVAPPMPQTPLMLAESVATTPPPAAMVAPAERFLHSAPAPATAGKMAASTPMQKVDAPLPYAARSAPVLISPPAPIALPAPTPTSAPAPAYVTSAATAPTHVSVTGAARKAEAYADATRAANWLHVIDAMLNAGLRNDAQEEWRKFRLAYPDYPVPEPLAKRIDATK